MLVLQLWLQISMCCDHFSKPFNLYLGQDAIHKLITSMTLENKYSSRMRKKSCRKELVMTKENNENVGSSAKCWHCDNTLIEGDVKVRGDFHFTGKYRGLHTEIVISMSL